jgi:acyl-CoA thioester hydrolase
MYLSEKVEINVRFNEADPLGIVWHGHYVRYFEDGREAFGEKFGFRYFDCYKEGFIIPIVSINCNYKRSLRYGEKVTVEARYIPTQAAKIRFDYTLRNSATDELVATGQTIQVFLDKETSVLQLTNPDFFEKWKSRHKITL